MSFHNDGKSTPGAAVESTSPSWIGNMLPPSIPLFEVEKKVEICCPASSRSAPKLAALIFALLRLIVPTGAGTLGQFWRAMVIKSSVSKVRVQSAPSGPWLNLNYALGSQ